MIVCILAIIICAIAGMLIGLPTLRLRGDYIAIVTLAFGEIIGRIVINGDELHYKDVPLFGGLLEDVFGKGANFSKGRQGITPIDKIDFPGIEPFKSLDLRPWFWTALVLVLIVLFVNYRLRDSRLGRAWIALREDEVAAASMGVPLVKTKLLAYATGAAFGGMAGVFLASLLNTVNADQFQFFFSIFILAMVILGGLGLDRGRADRRGDAGLHQLQVHSGRERQAARVVQPRPGPLRAVVGDLRLPAGDDDDPET